MQTCSTSIIAVDLSPILPEVLVATGKDRRDITLLSLTDQTTNLQGTDVSAQARVVSVSWQEGRLAKLLLKEGQEVTLVDGSVLKVSHPVTLSVAYTPEQVDMVAQVGQESSVTIPMSKEPAHVMVNDMNDVDYNWQSGQLTLHLPAGEVIVRVQL